MKGYKVAGALLQLPHTPFSDTLSIPLTAAKREASVIQILLTPFLTIGIGITLILLRCHRFLGLRDSLSCRRHWRLFHICGMGNQVVFGSAEGVLCLCETTFLIAASWINLQILSATEKGDSVGRSSKDTKWGYFSKKPLVLWHRVLNILG